MRAETRAERKAAKAMGPIWEVLEGYALVRNRDGSGYYWLVDAATGADVWCSLKKQKYAAKRSILQDVGRSIGQMARALA